MNGAQQYERRRRKNGAAAATLKLFYIHVHLCSVLWASVQIYIKYKSTNTHKQAADTPWCFEPPTLVPKMPKAHTAMTIIPE